VLFFFFSSVGGVANAIGLRPILSGIIGSSPIRSTNQNIVGNIMRRWYLWFILFGVFGSGGEIIIGSLFYYFMYPLFIYYNGFFTSIESFFLFGFFGCIGLRLVLIRYDLVKRIEKNS
jgi:hypothetical protein